MKNKYVYVPYEFSLKSEDDKKYEDFKREYDEEHEACPKCNALSHISLFMVYPFDVNNKQDYKDLNFCICNECGDEHIAHERVRQITNID